MDEKIFNLLEKVYVELQENTQRLNVLEVEVKEVKSEVRENSQQLNALEVEVKGLQTEVKEVKTEVKDNSLRLNRLEKEVTCTNKQFVQLEIAFVQLEKKSTTNSDHIILLENELHDKVGILFDGLEAVKKDIKDMKKDIKDMKKTLYRYTEKVEEHDSRIIMAEKKLNFIPCQI